MRQTKFLVGTCFARFQQQLRVNFRVGHVDASADFALAQTCLQYFTANFLTKLRPADAVRFGQAPEFGHRQIVLVGDAL